MVFQFFVGLLELVGLVLELLIVPAELVLSSCCVPGVFLSDLAVVALQEWDFSWPEQLWVYRDHHLLLLGDRVHADEFGFDTLTLPREFCEPTFLVDYRAELSYCHTLISCHHVCH